MLDNFTIFGLQFNLLDLLMAVLLLGTGLYCIYTAIRVRRECDFFENKMLLPGNCKPEECTDPEGFFDFIFPRILLFGVAMILCAVLDFGSLCAVRSGLVGIWLYWVQLIVPFGCFAWFIILQRSAAKRFW